MGMLDCPLCGDDMIIDSKKKTYVCCNQNCNHSDKKLYEDFIWRNKMTNDHVTCVREMIKEAIEEHDKEFRALLILLIQKGLVKDLNELKEVIQSMEVLDVLDNKKE